MYNVVMLNWLKLHFIPHEANGHRPHILHHKNIHRILGFVVFLEIFAFLIPSLLVTSNADTGNILPSILSELTNHERTQLNLPALSVNQTLNEAAQEKADDMAANQYFAHTSPDGKTPWFWLKKVGYTYSYAGENLAINFTDAKDLTQAWMNSPTHRANITKTNYTQVGTGVAEGTYQGSPTIFVVQVFGLPAATAAKAPETTIPTEVAKTPEPTVVAVETATPDVLGAETASAPAEVSTVQPESPVVSSGISEHYTNLLQRLMASPRNTTNILLFIIMGIVALAVFLNMGIKISHHHPDLILNGVMAIAVISSVFVINSYISKSNIQLVQSVGYSQTETTS
ncbi:MAG: hypothetical protein JWL92_282 [Candidatus Nomurabacteria bacterium]|nr:hypothetical protein [Candidatus Nomurabacteria bacterium]